MNTTFSFSCASYSSSPPDTPSGTSPSAFSSPLQRRHGTHLTHHTQSSPHLVRQPLDGSCFHHPLWIDQDGFIATSIYTNKDTLPPSGVELFLGVTKVLFPKYLLPNLRPQYGGSLTLKPLVWNPAIRTLMRPIKQMIPARGPQTKFLASLGVQAKAA